MKKTSTAILILAALILSSCTLLYKTIDSKAGFTQLLSDTETYIDSGAWQKAADSAEEARKAWEDVKPIIQVDVDHDYVNDIDRFFASLEVYIQTKSKPEALSSLALIRLTWKNISIL